MHVCRCERHSAASGQRRNETENMHLERVFVDVNSEQLKAILIAVAARLEGFSPGDVDQLCADAATLEPDTDVLIEREISFRGDALPFVIDVLKDAAGALEIVFFLPHSLTSLVQDAARAVVGASAVRSIVAD